QPHSRILDRRFEGREKVLTQFSFRKRSGGHVRSAFRLAVPGHVLQRGEYLTGRELPVNELALQSADGRDPHFADQERIFTEGLLDSPPARVASDVHSRGQDQVHAARADFARSDVVYLCDQAAIPRRCQPDRLREAGGAYRCVSVQSLLVKEHWYSQPGL